VGVVEASAELCDGLDNDCDGSLMANELTSSTGTEVCGNGIDEDCDGSDLACAPTTKANGQTCSVGSECTSGYCVESVCCDTACSGDCKSCSTGTCSNSAEDSQPSGCDGTEQYCDSSGNCKDMDWVATGFTSDMNKECYGGAGGTFACKPSKIGDVACINNRDPVAGEQLSYEPFSVADTSGYQYSTWTCSYA
jgi:hypothetical protein